jgi:hypothetical protein
VEIVIKSFRFLIVSGNARHVWPGMIENNAAKKISDEEMRILLAVRHTERVNACGASVRPVTAGRSRRRKNPAASIGGSVKKNKWGCINPHFCDYMSRFISALKLKGGASASLGIVTMTGAERLSVGKSKKISA